MALLEPKGVLYKSRQGDRTGIGTPAFIAAALGLHYSVADWHGVTSLPADEDEEWKEDTTPSVMAVPRR